MKNKINLACGLFLVLGSLSAQENKTKKATEAFGNYAYAPAIEKYESLVEKGLTDQQIYQNLGDANYANAQYAEAANWYSKLFKLDGANITGDYMYRYAQSLKSTKEYEASEIWMQKFMAEKSADTRSIKIAENPDYLNKIERHSGRYTIKNLALNSPVSDFAPALNGGLLVFATARDSGHAARYIHEWNNQPFLNLYSAKPNGDDYNTAAKLDNSVNKKTHESSAVFTKDGATVYFTRNNSENGNFSRDEKGVSRLKIYRANVRDGVWTNIVEMPFNSDGYSAAHPALGPDEKTLYFASDMPGTIGQSDIFKVTLNGDGTVSAPVNMGNTINTEARESFPFVTTENVLYFASDGHPGLGGLDIFATDIDDMGNLYVVNTGKPINGEQDDFSFIIDETTKKGFFSSNRQGGKGSDDIYSFTENTPIDLTCNTMVTGSIKDLASGEVLIGAKVAIYNAANQLVSETLTSANGAFALEGDCRNGDYNVVATKEAYDQGDKMFTVVKANNTTDIEINLEKSIKRAKPGVDLVKFLDLEPVYFDLNKAAIRPDAAKTIMKVLEYMNLFPDMKVRVESHTDVKAGSNYNNKLSQRRAENTVAYLLANGIDAARITGKGFGKSKLANECATRSSCTDDKHQENRRSEFIVIQ